MHFGFSVLGKFPFELSSFTLFPLAGIGYNMALSAKFEGEKYDDAMDLSQFGILAGAGIDYPITNKLFIRGEVLFNLRFASKYMKDIYDFETKTLGFGPRIKIGVGYRF